MISVCVATYNGEKYIRQQLLSILSQLDEEDEVIVADDGSTDNTINEILNLGDRRIKIIRQSQNLYDIKETKFGVIPKVSRNFFYAIKYANGDTIYLSDQDDVWLENKIKLCEEKLTSSDMVLHRRKDVNYNLEPILDKNNQAEDTRSVNISSAFSRPPFQGACMAFTKKVRNLLIDNLEIITHTHLSHDHILGFMTWILLGKNRIQFINDRLILYRRHGANVSSTGEKSNHSLLFKINYRIEVCRFLISLILLNSSIKN